jgi:hypothetical protein
MSFRKTMFSNCAAKNVKTTLRRTAAPDPRMMPHIRCFLWSDRTAKAITTALSPARIRSIRTMLNTWETNFRSNDMDPNRPKSHIQGLR